MIFHFTYKNNGYALTFDFGDKRFCIPGLALLTETALQRKYLWHKRQALSYRFITNIDLWEMNKTKL